MFFENEEIELRKSLSELREGIISLSAMLNKNGNGVVYFGVNDDGKIAGISLGKKTISDITHELQNNLNPLPTNVHIDNIIENEKTIIKLSAEGSDTPYSAYGRYYIRINDSDIIMHSDLLQTFFAKKEDTYNKWEKAETIYNIEDIDEDLLIDFVRNAFDK